MKHSPTPTPPHSLSHSLQPLLLFPKMGIISKQQSLQALLFIVTITSIFKTNNANLHILFPSLPSSTLAHPPSHSPAPSPSHHHHHHHHHQAHSPAFAPSSAPLAHPPTGIAVKPPAPAVKAPTHAPAKPPTGKPVTKPAMPPVKPPSTAAKRKFVAVQGMVYCKNCTYSGVNTLLGASPLPGARVVLRCRNTQYLLRKTTTTDKNGYFFLEAPPQVTTYGAHKCKIYLGHNPNTNGPCSNSSATNLNNGLGGAYLYSNNTGPPKPLPTFSLFSVGPFAYESTKCYKH